MREHGSALASVRVPTAPKRRLATRPVLLTAGAGGLAAVAAVGTLVATGGGTPAYAVTPHSDGTVTLALYQKSGIAGANAKLHQLGDGGWSWCRSSPAARASPRCPRPTVPAHGSACRPAGRSTAGGSLSR